MVFIFSLAFLILSVSWFIFRMVGYIGLISAEPVGQFVLAMACLSFLIAVISLYKILSDMRYKINDVKEKEKTVRDFYRYDQLLNPPDMDN